MVIVQLISIRKGEPGIKTLAFTDASKNILLSTLMCSMIYLKYNHRFYRFRTGVYKIYDITSYIVLKAVWRTILNIVLINQRFPKEH